MNKLQRQKVESSNIRSIGYENKTLEIEFHSGGTYRYNEVGEEVYKSFLEAESKGKYFHQYIKGVFECEKMGPDFASFTAKRLKHLVKETAEGKKIIHLDDLKKELLTWVGVYEFDDGKKGVTKDARDTLIAFIRYLIS